MIMMTSRSYTVFDRLMGMTGHDRAWQCMTCLYI